jgi:hypothetical protein
VACGRPDGLICPVSNLRGTTNCRSYFLQRFGIHPFLNATNHREAVTTSILIRTPNFRGLWLLKILNATKSLEFWDSPPFLGFTAIVFSAWLSMCVPSSRLLPADSVAGLLWN